MNGKSIFLSDSFTLDMHVFKRLTTDERLNIIFFRFFRNLIFLLPSWLDFDQKVSTSNIVRNNCCYVTYIDGKARKDHLHIFDISSY